MEAGGRNQHQMLYDAISRTPCSCNHVAKLKRKYSACISSARIEERIQTLPDLLRILRKRDALGEEVLREIQRYLSTVREVYQNSAPPPRLAPRHQPSQGTIKRRVKAIWYSTLFSFDLILRSLLHIAGALCHTAFGPFVVFCWNILLRLALGYAFHVRRPIQHHVRYVLRRDALGPPNVCSLLLFWLDINLINIYRILEHIVRGASLLLWYKLINLAMFSFLCAKYNSAVCEARNYIRLNVLGDEHVDALEIV